MKFFKKLFLKSKKEQTPSIVETQSEERVYCIEVTENELQSLKKGYVRKDLKESLNTIYCNL